MGHPADAGGRRPTATLIARLVVRLPRGQQYTRESPGSVTSRKRCSQPSYFAFCNQHGHTPHIQLLDTPSAPTKFTKA